GRPDDQFLFEPRIGIDDEPLPRNRLEPMMRNDGTLLGETLGHLFFFGKERFRNEEREIGVNVACLLEHAVERPLHLLPDGVAVWPNDHAAADVGILRQLGPVDDVEVPLRIVVGPGRDLFLLVVVSLLGSLLGHAWTLSVGNDNSAIIEELVGWRLRDQALN